MKDRSFTPADAPHAYRAPPSLPDQYNAARVVAGRAFLSPTRCGGSHRAYPECPGEDGTVPLLVTGVGRSGTHHTQHALELKGFDVCHEAVCADGSVSWTYAVVDPDAFYPWELARARIKRHRFRTVVHQVGGRKN